MILLELTKKEAEVIRQALALKKDLPPKDGIGLTEKEKEDKFSDLVLAKLEAASQPKQDALLSYKDLFLIIDSAKQNYLNLSPDLHISNKKVEENDFKHIALANAVIVWLSSKSLLKRLAKFDFTDSSCQYESAVE